MHLFTKTRKKYEKENFYGKKKKRTRPLQLSGNR